MLDKIERFLRGLAADAQSRQLDGDELRIAAAALLVHCARADGTKSAEEDAKLREFLGEHFALSEKEANAVIAAAERQERDAVDLYRFTRVLHARLDRAERKRMVQLLWEMADADGWIDHDEHQLVMLTAQLLDVEIRDSVAARQAALAKRDAT